MIYEVEQLCFTDGTAFSKSAIRSQMRPGSNFKWILCASSEYIAAYAVIHSRKNSSKARLYNIAVNPESRGKGHAKWLLSEVDRIASEMGKTEIHLEVRSTNDSAIALYEKNGFTAVGVMNDYYDKGVHALKMSKTISSRT